MPDLVTVSEFKEALSNAGGAGSRTAANLPDDRLASALEEANDEVTGALVRFTLPVPPTPLPGVLRGIIFGIAGYVATLEFYGSQPLETNDPVALRYERAQRLLKQLATGQIVVPGIDPDPGAPGAGSGDAVGYNVGPAVNLHDQAPFEDYATGRYGSGGAYLGGAPWV